MRLANQIAVVTGAGSGIGREIAPRFGREGAGVLAVDRNEDTAARTAAAIRSAGGDARHARMDISGAAEVAALAQTRP